MSTISSYKHKNDQLIIFNHNNLTCILVDEEEAETRRNRYVTDMGDLEQQFSDLKEQ